MFRRFIILEWKAFFRSSNFGKSMGLKILMGFMFFYFASLFLLSGIGLYPLLEKYFPGKEPITVVNQYLLIWFGLELILRFMLQNLPVLTIQPLLTTPIRKNKLVQYLLTKSLISIYNLLPLLVIIPFGLFALAKSNLASLSVLAWMGSIFAMSLSLNYLNILLKRKFVDNASALLPYAVGFLAVFLVERFGWINPIESFGALMNMVLSYPGLVFIPIILLILVYQWNQYVLKKSLYLDDAVRSKIRENSLQDFQWVRKFGDIAPFLQLDMKMIWRNKRPKSTIYISLLLIGYGLIFYPQESYQAMPSIFVFVGVFMTGIFMINFGQFIPAWDSSYYSMMMSQNIPLKKYLSSKMGLMTISVIILTILTTPYVFFGWNVLALNFACALYNIGVNVPVMLYFGSFNRKRIELDKGAFMNYQGIGVMQWLVTIPLVLLPMLLFWGASFLSSFWIGAGVLGGLGLAGFSVRSLVLEWIVRAYEQKKYSMINGFQQTGA